MLTVGYFLCKEPILTVFGGKVNEETFPMQRNTLFGLLLTFRFTCWTGNDPNYLFRWKLKIFLAAAVIGAITYIIFIFPLKMGMMGSAVATVIDQILTAALSLWPLWHVKSVKLRKNSLIFTTA